LSPQSRASRSKGAAGNEPGTLAVFARLLAEHGANVIYMLYDEDIDPASADIAMATTSPQEINRPCRPSTKRGYHYRVLYRGSDAQEAANIIGLNMVEKFFLRLKLLPTSDVAEIKSLIESSKDLYQDLAAVLCRSGEKPRGRRRVRDRAYLCVPIAESHR
jgi:hypothetical protein